MLRLSFAVPVMAGSAKSSRRAELPRYWSAALQEAPLAAFIPWSSLVDERTVMTRGGDLLCCWRLEGIAFETAGPGFIADCHESACNVLRTLGGGDFVVWTHLVRRPITQSLPAPCEPRFAVELDTTYQAGLADRPMMPTELYATLLFRRRAGLAFSPIGTGIHDIRGVRAAQNAALAELGEKAAVFAGGMREFRPGTVHL